MTGGYGIPSAHRWSALKSDWEFCAEDKYWGFRLYFP